MWTSQIQEEKGRQGGGEIHASCKYFISPRRRTKTVLEHAWNHGNNNCEAVRRHKVGERWGMLEVTNGLSPGSGESWRCLFTLFLTSTSTDVARGPWQNGQSPACAQASWRSPQAPDHGVCFMQLSFIYWHLKQDIRLTKSYPEEQLFLWGNRRQIYMRDWFQHTLLFRASEVDINRAEISL